MHSTVVVFPAPLAPTRPTISPARTSRSRPATTVLVPYVLRSPRTVTTLRSLVSLIVISRDWPDSCCKFWLCGNGGFEPVSADVRGPYGGGQPVASALDQAFPDGRRRAGNSGACRIAATAADTANRKAPYGPATHCGQPDRPQHLERHRLPGEEAPRGLAGGQRLGGRRLGRQRRPALGRRARHGQVGVQR